MKLYGIPNCNTVKTARSWLQANHHSVEFHDFKKHGVPEDRLDFWLDALGWETVVNRKGTTWRNLDDATRASIVDNAGARAALLSHPSLIKRPVLDMGNRIVVGFDRAAYEELFI